MKRQSSKNNKGMDIQSLLRNRNALYVVLVLAVMNLFSYLMLRQLYAVAFFIIIGFLMTYFSKNMIVVMLTSIVSTFFLVQINLLGKRQEGMTTAEEGKEEEEGGEGGEGEEYEEGEEDEGMEVKEKTAGAGTSTGTGTSTVPTERPSSMTTSGTDIPGAMREKFTASKEDLKPKKTNDETFTQKLRPARYNSADDDSVPRHKPKIDYAATLESAYDNLDKLLSSDAIKNMSADTGRLAEKQKVLMDNIGKLTPIMDKASSVLNNLDMGGISGLMGGIQERLKGFSKQEAKDM